MITSSNKIYNSLEEKDQFMIDCLASYWSPARVHKAVLERYGEEEEVLLKAILAFKLRNEKVVLARRKEIADEVPIINPSARFKMAQDVYDLAFGGVVRYTKEGKPYEDKDLKSALTALTLANTMSSTKDVGIVADDDLIRKVVQETFEQIKAENPKLKDSEIANLLMAELSENALPYVEELELIN